MELENEKALQILVALINRTPMTEAEIVGANACVKKIEAALKELKDFKSPPPVAHD